MSLLDDDRPVNPARHFINISNGELKYYDKESGSNLTVATPFEFIVLDQLSTVKGWSKEQDTGMWSNEVKRVGEQPFNVRTKNGIIASGLWRDIKDEVKADDGNFNAVVYLAAKGRDSLETQALLLKGAALNAWVEFTSKTNLKTNKIVIADWEAKKKGSVNYKVPVFTALPIEDAELEEAKALAIELRTYHNGYFSRGQEEHEGAAVDTTVPADKDVDLIDINDIPF